MNTEPFAIEQLDPPIDFGRLSTSEHWRAIGKPTRPKRFNTLKHERKPIEKA